jgi:hypothetical protein
LKEPRLRGYDRPKSLIRIVNWRTENESVREAEILVGGALEIWIRGIENHHIERWLPEFYYRVAFDGGVASICQLGRERWQRVLEMVLFRFDP